MFWFKAKKNDLANAVNDTVAGIQAEQNGLYEDYLRYSSLYRDREISGFKPGEWNAISGQELFVGDRISWNVVRAVVDSLVAEITVEKPSIRFQTTKGPETLQRQARLLEQFSLGALRDVQAWTVLKRMLKNAIIYGTGIGKVWPQDGRVMARSIHPSRFIVDDNSAFDTEPLSKFEIYYISRPALLDIIERDSDLSNAEKRERRVTIENTTTESMQPGNSGMRTRDLVKVIEAWREPINGMHGRHSIVTDFGVLHDDEQVSIRSPYTCMKFGEDLQGWHGISLVEQIEGCQREINRTLDKIRGNLEHLANAFVFADKNADISEIDTADNERYKVVRSLAPPQVITPPIANQQVFNYLNLMWSRAFELSGLSQLSATSSNPALPRLDSADALRSFQDIQTKRFSEVAIYYNNGVRELTELILRAGRQLKGKWAVKGLARGLVKRIEWDEVAAEESQYHMTVDTISGLPRDPAARLATVQSMIKSGMWTREEGLMNLAWPDVEKTNWLNTAPMEDLEDTMEHMLRTGEYMPPNKFQNHAMGMNMALSYATRARLDGVDPERVELLHRWMEETSAKYLNPEAPPPDALALPEDPLAGLPGDAAAAQQLAQAAATLPTNGTGLPS